VMSSCMSFTGNYDEINIGLSATGLLMLSCSSGASIISPAEHHNGDQ
jgi:hypothetical protein